MQIGYARVSTDDQHLDHQRSALRSAECRRIYEENLGRPAASAGTDQTARSPARGDVVVVTRLDRLARSTKDLLEISELLNRAGVGLRSLAEPWANTTSFREDGPDHFCRHRRI
ncbi:recombinase family protein [Klebsiella quasipneumoniae]|uniref:recombinase family protein n=1 Tax=Klebsiella quasipneumoniae TaxID=1463165 RepID=UPI00387B403D